MIKVVIKKKGASYKGVSISGHAYANEPGKDIVCAAVSVLGQTLANAVEEIAEIDEAKLNMTIDNGLLTLSIPSTERQAVVDILFRNFEIGIEGIVGGYPTYVKLIIKEVQGDDENF
jgi:uncharacterized protein YsxB (DUF464 family)